MDATINVTELDFESKVNDITIVSLSLQDQTRTQSLFTCFLRDENIGYEDGLVS